MKVPLIGLEISTGTLALGAVGLMIAPKVLPMLVDMLRTATKTGMKGGMIAYDKSRELISETRDKFQDIATEARSELSKGSKTAPKKKAAA